MTGATPGSNSGTGFKATYVTGLTDVSTVDVEGVGTLRYANGNMYKWVKFDNGTGGLAAIAGAACEYFEATGYSNNIVTRDSTDGGYVGAGVFVSVPADGSYCWIQIGGVMTLTSALEATALKADTLMMGTDGALTKWNANTTSAAAATVARVPVAQVLNATGPIVNLTFSW